MVFKSWLSLVAVTLLSSAALGQSSAVDTVDPIGAAARRQMSPALLPRQGLRCPIGTVWCPGFTRCAAPGATCCAGTGEMTQCYAGTTCSPSGTKCCIPGQPCIDTPTSPPQPSNTPSPSPTPTPARRVATIPSGKPTARVNLQEEVEYKGTWDETISCEVGEKGEETDRTGSFSLEVESNVYGATVSNELGQDGEVSGSIGVESDGASVYYKVAPGEGSTGNVTTHCSITYAVHWEQSYGGITNTLTLSYTIPLTRKRQAAKAKAFRLNNIILYRDKAAFDAALAGMTKTIIKGTEPSGGVISSTSTTSTSTSSSKPGKTCKPKHRKRTFILN